jgi:hypothetical protein
VAEVTDPKDPTMLNAAIVTALARHLLTAIGGGLAVRYGVDGATMDAIVGGLAALAGVAWSIWDKRNSARR